MPYFNFSKKGMTILLVILVLSALLAISFGIFNVVFLETQIAGEITGSMRAIYIAEQGLERTIYLDVDDGGVCVPGGSGGATCAYPTANSCICTLDAANGGDFINSAGACFRAVILKIVSPDAPCGPNNRYNCIASTGTYLCNGTN
ncbi:hypothetical protein KGQ34_02195, partial [Patescibacteria group bacterium]|nr:hypothetical protein [Patescibacteria group bacterium]